MSAADVVTHLLLLLLLLAAGAAVLTALAIEARAAYRDDWCSDDAAQPSPLVTPARPRG